MKTFILYLYLMNPAGQFQPPVLEEYPTMKLCETAKKAAIKDMKTDPKGYRFVRAPVCKPM